MGRTLDEALCHAMEAAAEWTEAVKSARVHDPQFIDEIELTWEVRRAALMGRPIGKSGGPATNALTSVIPVPYQSDLAM
jgi:hypothetical protein